MTMYAALTQLFGETAEAALQQAFALGRERFGSPTSFRHGYHRVRCRRVGGEATTPFYLDHLVQRHTDCEALFEIETLDGRWRPLLARDGDTVYALADLAAVIEAHLQETYHRPPRSVSTWLPWHYRRVPERWRIRIHETLVRRRYHAHPEAGDGVWPGWDFSRLVADWLIVLGLAPRPPRERRFVFSHDVDGAEQLPFAIEIAEIEHANGLRTTFFVPAAVLHSHAAEVQRIAALGHEIGLHGLWHDNRQLLRSPSAYLADLEQFRGEMDAFGITGYRAPSLLTSEPLREALAQVLHYDSSLPDTDVYSEAGLHHGCGAWRPYPSAGLIELPVTLPLDDRLHTLGVDDPAPPWIEKIRWLAARGGYAVVCTHANARYYPQGYAHVLRQLLAHLAVEPGWAIATAAEAASL